MIQKIRAQQTDVPLTAHWAVLLVALAIVLVVVRLVTWSLIGMLMVLFFAVGFVVRLVHALRVRHSIGRA